MPPPLRQLPPRLPAHCVERGSSTALPPAKSAQLHPLSLTLVGIGSCGGGNSSLSLVGRGGGVGHGVGALVGVCCTEALGPRDPQRCTPSCRYGDSAGLIARSRAARSWHAKGQQVLAHFSLGVRMTMLSAEFRSLKREFYRVEKTRMASSH